MTGANSLTPTLSGGEGGIQYSPKQKVIMAGTVMEFSHWVSTENGMRPFFHYYVEGKQFGYIKNDLNTTL